MLGHSDWLDEHEYEFQTIRDNVSLFTPELLDRINQAVVSDGNSGVQRVKLHSISEYKIAV
jgi:IS5 family transposase